MPQKGKMRKIQPADDWGKICRRKGKCEKYNQRMTAENMPKKREMKKTTTNSRLRQNAAVWENEGERKNGLMEIARTGH